MTRRDDIVVCMHDRSEVISQAFCFSFAWLFFKGMIFQFHDCAVEKSV